MPETLPRKFIREFKPSERVQGAYSIANAQLGKTRSDKPYLRCLIGDRTGEIPARMWSIEEATFARLPTDGFVWLEGETQPYQGELQLIIHTIDLFEPGPQDLADLLPCSKYDPEEMLAEVRTILATLQHPAMRALADAFLDDAHFVQTFRQCPAAKSMHHAYLGGLLEHTLSLLRLGNAVCPLYPKLNRDIVLMGLFVHDLGKTRELVYDRTFSYSDRGELVGHIVDGVIMLREKAHAVMREKGIRFPSGVMTVLEHIVISHHGVPEFGAVKVPATPEAVLVSLLDNLDAKTHMAISACRPDTPREGLNGNFTEKNWGLATKLYKPDPLA